MRRDLNGKRVLIAGASSGVGSAAGRAFARAGADVALVARRREGLEAVARDARIHGVRAHVVVADLGEPEACVAAVEEAAAVLGGLDLLVWNAASMAFGLFREVSRADFDRTVRVTFGAAVDTIRAALPHLERAEHGGILVVGSLMSRAPLPTFSSYAASKHALRGFINSLRVELRHEGSDVTVSMVHPGAVNSPLWGNVTSATGRQPRNPPDAYAPEEIARALVAVAQRPRREFTVGGEGRVVELGYAMAPPLGDLALRVVTRWYRSGRRPSPVPGGLWEGQGSGRAGGRRYGRPSLWARIRLRVRWEG